MKQRRNRWGVWGLVAFVSAGVSACQTLGIGQEEASKPLVYGSDAAANLKKGNDAMSSKNFIEARRYFDYVRTKYPYIEAAVVAELRLADADFEAEQYSEARERYKNFVRLHPLSPEVDYAAWRSAYTHVKDAPSDFFLLPSPSEKDQTQWKAAQVALGEFLRSHPNSKYAQEASTALLSVRRQLAEHELYSADFYARRARWPAVVARLTVVTENYTGIGYDERAFFGLHDAWLKLKDPDKAKAALRDYLARNPQARDADRARRLLGPG